VKVPLLDLQAQYRSIKTEIDKAVAEVFESQHFILGPNVAALEKAVTAYCDCAHACGVSSGTDALSIALMAEEIGPGDEVITSPYTFFATVSSIARIGAKPVFVDIDPVTYNLHPVQAAAKITSRTKAIMPVHLYGQSADMDPIMDLAKQHRLVVIEDACQAIGAEYKGRRVGGIGHYGCFSFFPSKNLGGAGDGGMVTTGDPQRAAKLNSLRNHGMEPKYIHKMIGGNFRLDALQAAVLNVKLKHLERWTAMRRANAARYNRLFEQTSLMKNGTISLPAVIHERHVFNQYVIRAKRRDGLIAHLKKHDIGCEVYYPVPLHLQECFVSLGHKAGDFPESERAARETLALPVYPELTAEQAKFAVDTIADFYRSAEL
jgi:dTDP-4-amino-4,6-dideoxygalactose transaminase